MGQIRNFFTVIGVLSAILTIIRFVYNSKKKTWTNNFSIMDYPGDYDVEQKERNAIYTKLWDEEDENSKIIVFKPIDCVIPKVQVIELNESGKKKRTLETFRYLTPQDSLCFKLERSDCIPKFKIKWYSDYGEYNEHYFCENRRNGISDVTGVVYSATLLSVIRKAFGFK